MKSCCKPAVMVFFLGLTWVFLALINAKIDTLLKDYNYLAKAIVEGCQ